LFQYAFCKSSVLWSTLYLALSIGLDVAVGCDAVFHNTSLTEKLSYTAVPVVLVDDLNIDKTAEPLAIIVNL
jgi:hypothetical protein